MDVIDVDIRFFSYKGEDFAALKNVRFSVERGELVVLTGNSGCGKTTLMRAMNGLIPDQYEGELDGRIELLGKSLGEFSSGELARAQDEVRRVQAKLDNAEFVAKAPERVVNAEREKLEKYQAVAANLQAALEQLG